MKINSIVFGLTGLDTAPIVRAMKKDAQFENVVWFGLVEGVDINTYEAYKYHADYDYTRSLPEDYQSCMNEVLGSFLISSSRRNETHFNAKTYTLGFGSTYEYLHHFSRYCYMIYDLIIKNRINLIIIDAVPHTSIDVVLCQAAKYFNIKLLFLYQSCIANRFMYFSELSDRKVDFSLYYSDKARPVKNEYKHYKVEQPKQPFFMQDFSRYFYNEDKLLNDLLKGEDVKQKGLFAQFKKSKTWVGVLTEYFKTYYTDLSAMEALTSCLLKFIKYKQYEKRLNELSQKTPDLDTQYVYFPLNFQPELTTECLAGSFYTDILSAVEKTRSLIPSDWKIYIKEHMMQYEFARDQIFFERLKAIPNIVVVERTFSSFELIENSQFVATLNGTAGWEAIHMGKKALNFGTIYYQGLPGVICYSPSLKLDDLLTITIDKVELETAINTLISRMDIGVISADYSAIVENFDADHNANLVLNFIHRFFFNEQSLTNNSREYSHDAS